MQSMLAEKFTRTAYYLCKDGKCENYAEVYRSWTDRNASLVRPVLPAGTLPLPMLCHATASHMTPRPQGTGLLSSCWRGHVVNCGCQC